MLEVNVGGDVELAEVGGGAAVELPGVEEVVEGGAAPVLVGPGVEAGVNTWE